MGKMPTNALGKSSELKLHCFCLFDSYSMPKNMCSVHQISEKCTILLSICIWYDNMDLTLYPDKK